MRYSPQQRSESSGLGRAGCGPCGSAVAQFTFRSGPFAALVATQRGDDDMLYEIAEAWGESYRVVALSVEYAPDAEPDTAAVGRGG